MATDTLNGSCLCGAVAYEIKGEAAKFYHCHCQRCRKASGTGHCSNIIMPEAQSISWTRGADHLTHYKVPDAIRFSTCFCKTCGSLLPREIPGGNMVIIPAGSLDSETTIKPQARIFWDSRSDWSCSDANTPVFSEYPE